jgi:formate dehydrogenase maturation protein FdhE
METLFNESEIFQKKRPSKLTGKQERDFYLEMAKEVIENNWSSDDEDTIATDLSDLSLSDNGYEMAKDLESYTGIAEYSIDVDFCKWLDNLFHEYKERMQLNVKEWVKSHKITPKYSIGDQLKVLSKLNRVINVNDIIFVAGIHDKEAEYVVNFDINHKGGTIIDFELIESNCIKL